MSGHSHWATIKRKKGAEDERRGKVFSKIARMISVAAREGGDPNSNPKLRSALEEAKKVNMPKDNVERAIKRGAGEETGGQLEEVLYEAIGPGGINIIMEGITDNKNRTLAEVKQILQKNGGKLADEGSLQYLFGQKGIILINLLSQKSPQAKEALEMAAIEAGAEDTRWLKAQEEEFLEVSTALDKLETVKKSLESQGVVLESSTLGWQAKQEIEADQKTKAKLEELFEELDDNEAIQEIYSNLRA